MSYVISGYEPKRVFEIFEDICAIPHGSGNERGVARYILDFASKNGLYSIYDETGNVFIRKNAAEGYENSEPILLQGHMDMVCEKNADSEHDFLHDGLKLSVKNGYLWADGTTLGGDNGIAVAMMLALLETDKHPALECLFTVEEETGLAGAKGFDTAVVTAKKMINLDSEEEWQVTAGCAGGCRTEVKFPYTAEELPAGHSCLKLTVSGLSGGHSGAEIHCGKLNAIIAMGRLLSVALEAADIRIVSLSGGGKDNAIARESVAIISSSDTAKVGSAITAEAEKMKRELCSDDIGFTVSIEPAALADFALPLDAAKRIITFLLSVKTGVLKMSNQISGLVEYSRNAGILTTSPESVDMTFSSRSSIEAELDLSCRELDMLCSALGAQCSHYSRYPGWEYAPVSPLRDSYISAYKKLFGKDLTVGVIHAGLECGILSSKLGEVDIISVGPNMFNIHSPDEHLDLASCENVWRVLSEIVTKG